MSLNNQLLKVLADSKLTFKSNFGDSLDADWIYADLYELLKDWKPNHCTYCHEKLEHCEAGPDFCFQCEKEKKLSESGKFQSAS